MKDFFRRISPRRAVTDFADQWQQPTPHRWQILGVACAATFAVFMLFIPDSQKAPPARPEVMYISTFDEGRTEGEIIASNCANQELKNELEARIAASEERKREIYKALGRATFIDVDAMEEEIAEEQASEGEPAGPTPEEVALSVEEYCARATG
ncbi:hypothetical protein [Aurantiacibacter poecillastricola]|uniref:hypothetical protein n=1 Tax=Aurantiacibacter poecillastricola TaxID=3064385 RepID=UPI00273E6B23|nr:hypothetical protein [Aurantiacibacter sp. 219JJ12-13]MDP5263195.1 hypothetical protein [Aurantiacibacter sp. 219JJ12-13]